MRNGAVIKTCSMYLFRYKESLFILIERLSPVLDSSKVQYIRMSNINTWIENQNGEEIHRYWSMQVFCYAKIVFFYRQQL